MTRIEKIKSTLDELFKGSNASVMIEDESRMHSRGGTETHLKILVVSDRFKGLGRVARQRLVQDAVQQEFSEGLHALTLRCLTVDEATQDPGNFSSPACASKVHDK